ncbi:MAG: lytic murein transglycosylase [Actinomycetota bacterium]|nr:lytic murein transglycosylase [Actinomycetota bacterium]
MFGAKKLRVAVAATGAAVTVMGVAAIPVASAGTCVVTVTVVGGAHLSFNLPSGTNVDPHSLAPGVIGVSESCQAAPSPQTTHTTTTGASSSSSSSSTGTAPRPGRPGSPSATQQPTSHNGASKGPGGKPGGKGPGGKPGGGGNGTQPGPAGSPGKAPVFRGQGGVPSLANPTFSFALPGPAPLGVPNFFIDSFRIPPFLLPIYQAAGIQYNVPWQVLAAINEIETDYGRNLSVSSAGAVGWMQFLPATWKQWGVDANGDGVADPYNPVDAIFAAARYLQAAGASKNLGGAVFTYNHASWYVQSVLLRAKLIGGMPDQLLGALTGLVQGHFPVAARAKYADDSVEKLATRRVHAGNAAIPVNSTQNKSVAIFANQKAPVIAVNDGKIVKVGQNAKLGRFVQLQDQTGNIYTYAQLGSVPKQYAVPKPVKLTPADLAKQTIPPVPSSPHAPASAGQQQVSGTVSTAKATKEAKSAPRLAQTTSTSSAATPVSVASVVKERLFAYPSRPASYASGGALQLRSAQAKISSFQNYFTDTLHLARDQYTLAPLRAGAIVVAGTILGRLAGPTAKQASHMEFMVQPAGKNAPQIDPKPILDGWKLLEATAVYRASGVDPFFGPGAKNATIGQILLESKEQLQNRILQDPHVQVYACGRRDIQAGLIDRRVLATLEFLAASALQPTVSGLVCGHNLAGLGDAAGASGSSVDISKINNIPILGHQGNGSITDMTVRRLLTLQAAMKPDQIISQMSYKGQSNTLALPDHSGRIQVTFTPLFGTNKKLSNEIKTILKPGQWIQLINRISQIPEPVVPIVPSKYAVRAPAP